MSNVDSKALYKISYGLYVATTFDGAKHNGMILNTAIQVTSSPERVSVTINKANYSCEVIKNTGKLNVCCLSVDAPFSVFERFGFKSGKDVDKFIDYPFSESSNKLAVLKEYINAYMSLSVVNSVDLGTHIMFICDITEAKVINDLDSMTYDYYQKNVKPKKEAPKKQGYVCKVCGYFHEGDSIDSDFICPICKHGVDVFEKVEDVSVESTKTTNNNNGTTKYKCLVCGAEFELKDGDKLECPICGVGEEYLQKIN
ncbi:MAG: flavin reductase, partial [Clostridia bacterium]|nr:flavin reductase [Clostridia bacterium]